MNDPKTFEDIVNKMSKKDIQKIAKQVLDGGQSFEVVFKPNQTADTSVKDPVKQ